MKIVSLDASTLGADIDLSLYEKYGELTVYQSTAQEEFADHVGDSDVIIINKLKVGRHNLPACPSVKLICVTATGYDNIDTEYCKEKGIAVCNVVGYSTQNVAQLTVAMALSLICHLGEYNRSVADGTYSQGTVANILTPVYHEIYGKTWGIVGYGNIGKQVGAVAKALGCKVIVHKRTEIEGEECVDIDTLCKESDIISVHTPLNDGTRVLISRERIAMMKNDAIFINVARGAVVDEAALTDAVLNEKIGGIGVDVYSKEPFPTDHPYASIAGRDNVIFTPHMAWGSYEARVRCCDEIALNIEAFLAGEIRNRVV
ncbi:MAG: hydroxyacid dehydrogenase [Ruminococcaceae bacterium]|nr:hydroxyacid dehydrogenase [Oscillospiraceae bacterium]